MRTKLIAAAAFVVLVALSGAGTLIGFQSIVA